MTDEAARLMRQAADLFAAGDGDGAAHLFQRAVKARPDDPDTHANLGFLYRSTGHYLKALACYERAAALDEADLIRVEIANCLVNLGRVTDARGVFDRLLATPQGRRAAASSYLMAMLYDPGAAPEAIAAEHRRLTKPWRCDERPSPGPRTGAPVRVGYLTADFFGEHPVAQFLAPLIERHAVGGAVESIAYDARPKRDGTAQRMGSLIGVRAIDALDDDAAADLIRADGIDILVDLSGHTSGRRLAILGCRPAPVTACFIGYPSTTGYAAVDWLIGDSALFPDGKDNLYTERLARLPGPFLAFAPPPSMLPPRASRKGGPVIFGSLNHFPKLNDGVVALWGQILREIPDARLLLQCAAFAEEPTRAATARRFEALGVGRNRLDLHGPQPFPDAMARYADIDIALDPFPYNGGTTSVHALHQGAAVVTLAGDYFCGRMGVSLLTAAGKAEWIASSRARYVEIACDLARRIAGGEPVRETLIASRSRAPLFDVDRWATDVAALYARMAMPQGGV